jgi:hypothetical protein
MISTKVLQTVQPITSLLATSGTPEDNFFYKSELFLTELPDLSRHN